MSEPAWEIRGASGPLDRVNVTSPQFKADPFPFYARLRREAPVFPVSLGRQGTTWLITRYDDVVAALKDPRLAKNRFEALTPSQLKRTPRVPAAFGALERNLLSLDGADHNRLKGLVRTAFVPRRIEGMREQIQSVADDLLNRAATDETFDLIADYAAPLPAIIIGRILGVPEHDNAKFRAWTQAFVAATTQPLRSMPRVLRFMRYLRGLIDQRAAQPRDDLISALVQARDGTDRLSADEVLAMVFLLLSAGHETTVNLIASGALALLTHPDQSERLRADAVPSDTAVEELLRFVVPAETATPRYTRTDVEIAGTSIPQGSMVLAVIASANRDPDQFPDPDTLDLARTPNRHLAFGHGIHYCLGAPLSRLEGQIALHTLFTRVPKLRLTGPPDQLRWRATPILRGLKALPVRL